MWLWIAAALAADPSAGMIWPGAGDVRVGEGEVGVVAGGITGVFGEAYGAAGVRGHVSPVAGVVVSAGALACGYRQQAWGCFGAAARGLIVDRPELRFGLSGGFARAGADQLGVGAALVFEVGARVRFDLAWPLYVDDVRDNKAFEPGMNLLGLPLIFAELGLTAPVGEHGAFRVGKDLLSISLSYRHELPGFAVEARFGSTVIAPSFTASTQVVWRWGGPR